MSAKHFNILVDAVAREWVQQLGEESELEEEVITELMATFFAIFYIDDGYLASQDLEFLPRVLNILVELFACVGFKTNAKKIQTMICTPRRIQTQLPMASHQQKRQGLAMAGEWDSWKVQCHQCNKMMFASSLRRHLADQHKVYQQLVVAEELLGAQAGVTYQAHPDLGLGGRAHMPHPRMRRGVTWRVDASVTLQRSSPLDKVVILMEGYIPWCELCAMQVNPA